MLELACYARARMPLRPSHVWYLIAVLWAIPAALAGIRHGVRAAWLPALFALLFLLTGLFYRRREHQQLRRKQP